MPSNCNIENLISPCRLCPRMCEARRDMGERGFCQAGDELVVARAALHMWEEPCISGAKGSGTVFFSHCNLGCVFCQNSVISQDGKGKRITIERLSDIFLELQDKGANNINLVTAVHYVPWIIKALELACNKGLKLPILYNSGGYESLETIKMLEDYVDIYLPDFKYITPELAGTFSKAEDYPAVAKAAIGEMLRQKRPSFDEKGMMREGVIIRHMVLPGHTRESIAVLEYIAENYGNDTYISLLSQYTPMPGLTDLETIDKNLQRKITTREYDKVVNRAIELGFENAFLQERCAAREDFIPDFDGEGV